MYLNFSSLGLPCANIFSPIGPIHIWRFPTKRVPKMNDHNENLFIMQRYPHKEVWTKFLPWISSPFPKCLFLVLPGGPWKRSRISEPESELAREMLWDVARGDPYQSKQTLWFLFPTTLIKHKVKSSNHPFWRGWCFCQTGDFSPRLLFMICCLILIMDDLQNRWGPNGFWFIQHPVEWGATH